VQLAVLRHKVQQKPVAGLWHNLGLVCWAVLLVQPLFHGQEGRCLQLLAKQKPLAFR
jgi:hypothetical protein